MDDDWLADLLIDDKIMITKSVIIPAVSGLYRPTDLLFIHLTDIPGTWLSNSTTSLRISIIR